MLCVSHRSSDEILRLVHFEKWVLSRAFFLKTTELHITNTNCVVRNLCSVITYAFPFCVKLQYLAKSLSTNCPPADPIIARTKQMFQSTQIPTQSLSPPNPRSHRQRRPRFSFLYTIHPPTAKMSFFKRAKKLDLGCFVNIKTIRDHTKRMAFAEYEAQRYVFRKPQINSALATTGRDPIADNFCQKKKNIDKPSDMPSATRPCPLAPAPSPSFSSARCTATPALHRSGTGVSWAVKGVVSSAISR